MEKAPLPVYFLMLPEVHLLDMAGPAQALYELSRHLGTFRTEYISPVRDLGSWQGLQLSGLNPLPDTVPPGAIIIVCASKWKTDIYADAASAEAVEWLRAIYRDDIRLVGICTGSFLLGRAGFLDGRKCTTHHLMIDELQNRYPAARVLSERIFVQDANLYTSAGVTAGIDLTLHLIHSLVGQEAAIATARDLVVYIRRMGDDPQISTFLRYRNHCSPLVHSVQDYLARNMVEDISVASVAARFHVSSRHLQRVFKAHTGASVKDYLTQLRLEAARGMLQKGDQSVDQVADKVGFNTTGAFRNAWRKHFDRPPREFRQAAG